MDSEPLPERQSGPGSALSSRAAPRERTGERLSDAHSARVLFPDIAATCSLRGNVTFVAMVETTEVICEISPEALVDHFGARRTDRSCLLAAFEAHRQDILPTVEALIPHRLSGRRCLLFSRDFLPKAAPDVLPLPDPLLRPQPDTHPPPP
jgi:hypothetical protein